MISIPAKQPQGARPGNPSTEPGERYHAIGLRQIRSRPEWSHLAPSLREGVEVVGRVLPFRTNSYVLGLVDWDDLPDDPIFQLTFPQVGMLDPADYRHVSSLLDSDAKAPEVRAAADEIRMRLNPHPAGQLTHNVPRLDGRPLAGLQHKYRETVLFFPAQGQTCHAYCTYCFRWAQFVGLPDLKFQARETDDLVGYLGRHPEVTDVLVTGGDPLIMSTATLKKYIDPLLAPELGHVQSIRVGSKSLAYWPARFVSDSDADELIRYLEQIVASGRHVALMAHFSHPRELGTRLVREAIRRVRDAGVEIRMQAPLIRRVNDDPVVWSEMWRTGVRLGMIPYYLFVERDTGPKGYFEVSIARAYQIFRDAYQKVSGLARTVRGPSMSATPGKVRVLGVQSVGDEKVFLLDFLQARNPMWVRRPFFARFDPRATWFDQLRPAFGERHYFFDGVRDREPHEREALKLRVAV
jgi:KamA family protein